MELRIPAAKSSRARRRNDVRVVPAESTRFTLADLCQLLETIPKPDAGYRKAVKQAIRSQGKFADCHGNVDRTLTYAPLATRTKC